MAKFQKGNSGNPGGFSRAQIKTRKMIEGLAPKAVRTLEALLDSPEEAVRLGAAKVVLDRVAPAPKASTNVNIAVGGGHAAALRAVAERRQLVALPMPEAADVTEVTATPLDRVSDSE